MDEFNELEQQVAFEGAGAVHEAWCIEELSNFYVRFREYLDEGRTPGEALQSACYKNDKKRNEARWDIWGHENIVPFKITSFEGFCELFKNGIVEVERFKDGENILVSFDRLSEKAQQENLSAATSAISTYIKLKKAGLTDEQILSPKNQERLGRIIHTDWMRRNDMNENNSYLFVPYEELGDWEKGQDLTVFNAVYSKIQEHGLEIQPEENVSLPSDDELKQLEFDVSNNEKQQTA